MNMTRKNFLAAMSAAFAAGCCSRCPFTPSRKSKIALQLYSIRNYINKVGIEKAIADVAEIGYTGVEICGFDAKSQKAYGKTGKELKAIFDKYGVVMCGGHYSRSNFAPEQLEATCRFSLDCGSNILICPGGGNFPPGATYSTGRDGKITTLNAEQIRFTDELVKFYNQQADAAAKYGCRIGLHNHTWEFALRMPDGTTFWDYFFSHTKQSVLMEQDVGWTTQGGFSPADQYAKYPHRSPTLHAKENGYGCKGRFDAILGKPGENLDGTTVRGVDWERLFEATELDGVEWYVVETEKHEDSLEAVRPSYDFLYQRGFN